MIEVKVNKERFQFKYLADYASFLLKKKIIEFVTVNIRFCREAELPLLKPLEKYSEEKLVDLSLESNRELLSALSTNSIAEHIEKNTQKWVANRLEVIDKEDIKAEDLTLAYYLRRKSFAYFLDTYTKNLVLQKLIIAELDDCTTREEIISCNVYLQIQREKMVHVNMELTHHKNLLLEAQELSGIGSYLINFRDASKSFFTPEYNAILEDDSNSSFEKLIERIHPEDRQKLTSLRDKNRKDGGDFEIEYRYMINGKEKLIWTKGVSVVENGHPSLIRGTIRDITTHQRSGAHHRNHN